MRVDAGTMKLIFAEAEAGRAPLHRIEGGFHGADIFIGNRQAASNPEILAENGIGVVLNCAVNLDINMVTEPAGDVQNLVFGWGPVRYYKLGMIDGAGNSDDFLMAGYFLLRGLLTQEMPDKPSYPWKTRGHLLVHCRGGRSRSVILVALFLHIERPETYPTLDAAIAHVRVHRQLDPKEWPSAPKQVLIDAATRCATVLKQLQRNI
ncbi:protein phosphatase [Cognatishimia sp.]|uniref:protein phosphatase n=1 Tax=Cognatishimia sp. TaxID=2211648 RepID=UPI0035128B1B